MKPQNNAQGSIVCFNDTRKIYIVWKDIVSKNYGGSTRFERYIKKSRAINFDPLYSYCLELYEIRWNKRSFIFPTIKNVKSLKKKYFPYFMILKSHI